MTKKGGKKRRAGSPSKSKRRVYSVSRELKKMAGVSASKQSTSGTCGRSGWTSKGSLFGRK